MYQLEQTSAMMIEQTGLQGSAASKVDRLVREHPLPRKLATGPKAASALRDGVVFLLLLLAVAIVMQRYRKRNTRPSPADEEAPQDDGPALPGPHIDANTRMQLGNRPQTFYDWVRASNAASRAQVA